uniref:Uncharacterized protein n=1 Tax=Anopheles albimanus TaxID=7167 RepID=A0A182F8H7_ANOAL
MSVTASSTKSIVSTPFSINDILTRSRRSERRSSGESSGNEEDLATAFYHRQSSGHHHHHHLHYHHRHEPHRHRGVETSDSSPRRPEDAFYGQLRLGCNNNNNNNSTENSKKVGTHGGVRFLPNGLPPALRRGSLDCFMVSSETASSRIDDNAPMAQGCSPLPSDLCELDGAGRTGGPGGTSCYRLPKIRNDSPIDMRRSTEHESDCDSPSPYSSALTTVHHGAGPSMLAGDEMPSTRKKRSRAAFSHAQVFELERTGQPHYATGLDPALLNVYRHQIQMAYGMPGIPPMPFSYFYPSKIATVPNGPLAPSVTPSSSSSASSAVSTTLATCKTTSQQHPYLVAAAAGIGAPGPLNFSTRHEGDLDNVTSGRQRSRSPSEHSGPGSDHGYRRRADTERSGPCSVHSSSGEGEDEDECENVEID